MKNKKVLIIGAGFSGLAAALELEKHNVSFTIVEKKNHIGGLSRTINIGGVKFELGPHIYFDRDPEVSSFWKELVGTKMKSYERNNRIFYQGKYIKSPLSIWDAFIKLGPIKVVKMLISFGITKLQKHQVESAEDWVIANFGRELFKHFFKVYNEKIWGIDCKEISSNWAGQRIKSSLFTMVLKSLKRDKDFIIKTFDFPDGGSESIYQAQFDKVKANSDANLLMDSVPTNIRTLSEGFEVDFSSGEKNVFFSDIISTIHLDNLIQILETQTIDAEKLLQQSKQLLYRNLVLVNLVFDKKDVKNFKEHWIDIHDPNIKALRVTNFGNYEFGLANDTQVGVGLEYNCFEEDIIWKQTDPEILKTALLDLQNMQLSDTEPIHYQIIRLPKSYPVYFKGYDKITKTIFDDLNKIKDLQLVGRNSMYKWNNMHHSVKTGMLAARNIVGQNHDLLAVKGMVAIGKDSD